MERWKDGNKENWKFIIMVIGKNWKFRKMEIKKIT